MNAFVTIAELRDSLVVEGQTAGALVVTFLGNAQRLCWQVLVRNCSYGVKLKQDGLERVDSFRSLWKVSAVSRLTRFLASTIGQKYLMGATGLLLCGFLVTHLAGNLNVFLGPEAFNAYAEKLHSLGPLLVAAELGLFLLFLIHIGLAIALTLSNRAARGDRGYSKKQTKQEETFLNLAPRSWMFISGGIVLIFLVYHVAGMKFGVMDDQPMLANTSYTLAETATVDDGADPGEESDELGEKAPYNRVIGILRSPISAIVYIVGVTILGFHLSHGFASAFRSLGLTHPRYTPLLRKLGVAFAVVIALGFLSIPIYIWVFQGGGSPPGG